MGTVAYGLRWAVELLLVPFDAMPPWLGLTLVSVLTGAGMLWVVGKTTPQRRLERARDRMAAAVYETRLFLDAPLRMLRAQGRLLGWGGAYVGYMMPALLVMIVPLGLVFLSLDARFGYAALPVGEPIVVRVALDGDGADVTAELPAEAGAITAPPLYDARAGAAYFRVQLAEPGTHTLTVRAGDATATKRLSADPSALQMAPDRASGTDLWLSVGSEPPLSAPFTSITLAQPPTTDTWLGMPWWLYWLLVATVAALALRKPLGVVI